MTTVVILSIGVAIAVALPIAWRVRQRRFDPFEPIVVFALAWGVMFVVRPLAMVIREDFVFYGVDIGPKLDTSVLLGLVGAVAFVVGYELDSPRMFVQRLPRLPANDLTSRASLAAVVVGITATTIFVVFLLWSGGTQVVGILFDGRSEELNEVLRDSPLFLWSLSLAVVPAALVGFAVAYVHPGRLTIAVAALLCALALFRIAPTGGRGYILTLLGTAVVFVYLHRGKRPGPVAVAVGLIVALVGSYAILMVRDADARDSVGSVLERLVSPGHVLAPLTKRPDSEMAPALAGALTVIPSELRHRYGAATFGDLAARPIPRHFWAEKPLPHTIVVTEAVWPVARETGDFQPAFTPLLSFYWDFGVPGAFLGLALYGWIARLGYGYFSRDPRNTTTQLLYALALSTLVVAVRSDPVLLFFHLVVMFGPVLTIAFLESGRKGRDRIVPGRGLARIGEAGDDAGLC
jgi:hypothetical protein